MSYIRESAEKALKYYDGNVNRFRDLKEEVLYSVNRRISQSNVKIHSVDGRVKDRESVKNKVERKKYKNPESDIEDFVGIRIVCLFVSQIPDIVRILENEFEKIDEDDKIVPDDLESFGYMARHLILRLNQDHAGARYEHIKNFKFEAQVRTISMDAWASISHYLDYKSIDGVPRQLRRDFHALSGLFYVADTHFEMFFKEKEEFQNRLSESFSTSESFVGQPLSVDSLGEYLKLKFPKRHEEWEFWWDYVSELYEELNHLSYDNIEQLDKDLDRSIAAFEQLEKDHNAEHNEDALFSDVAFVRICLDLLYPDQRGEPRSSMAEPYRHLVEPKK
jgi:ppGpp synthetase/RelA/SpoT-type nucleotidyltranferase